jgi:hypothetical protein
MLAILVRQSEIAEMAQLSISTVRKIAMGDDWPAVELRIGNVNFYRADAIRAFFAARVDGRTIKGRKRKRHK